MKLNRRDFTKSIIGLGGIGIAGSALGLFSGSANLLEIGQPELTSIIAGSIKDFKVNSAKIIKFGNKPLILIRKKDGRFTALSAICVHQDNLVQYREDKQQVVCACHHEVYDLKGRAISGTSKHLDEYSVQVSNDQVVITA